MVYPHHWVRPYLITTTGLKPYTGWRVPSIRQIYQESCGEENHHSGLELVSHGPLTEVNCHLTDWPVPPSTSAVVGLSYILD